MPFFLCCQALESKFEKLLSSIILKYGNKNKDKLCCLSLGGGLILFSFWFVSKIVLSVTVTCFDVSTTEDWGFDDVLQLTATVINLIVWLGVTVYVIRSVILDNFKKGRAVLWGTVSCYAFVIFNVLCLIIKSCFVSLDEDLKWWDDRIKIIQATSSIVDLFIFSLLAKPWLDTVLSSEAVSIAGGSLYDKKNWFIIRCENEGITTKKFGNLKSIKSATLRLDTLRSDGENQRPQFTSNKFGINFTSSEEEDKDQDKISFHDCYSDEMRISQYTLNSPSRKDNQYPL